MGLEILEYTKSKLLIMWDTPWRYVKVDGPEKIFLSIFIY